MSRGGKAFRRPVCGASAPGNPGRNSITVPVFIVGSAFLGIGNPVAQFLGFCVLIALTILGLMGSAGLSRHIGQRLSSPLDEGQPWRCVLRGGIVLSITFLFPFVGWFLVLPLALVSGVGAAALSLRSGKTKSDMPAMTPDVGVAGA